MNDRKAFGKPVAGFQNTRFKLAEIATEVQVMRVFVDRCMELLLEKKLDTATASMAKLWATDMEGKVLDECLQLHGGYGFMWEFPISQAYVDARVHAHLRRHQRNHEGSHFPFTRTRRQRWLKPWFSTQSARRAAAASRAARCTKSSRSRC